MRPPESTDRTVVVIGAGLIGLVTAWRAAQRGLTVTVVAPESSPGDASRVAAGMLTPATEAMFGEEDLMRFAIHSRDLYPAFIAELEAETGLDTGYRTAGTLQVAFDRDDLVALTALGELRTRLGIDAERLTSRECRRLEPLLSPNIRGGVHAPHDRSVDPRRLATALSAAAELRGVLFVRERATEVVRDGSGAATGVRLASGAAIRADQVVIAAGTGSPAIGGLPEGTVPPVRPVKGQLLRLRTPAGAEPLVTRTVRGLVKGAPVYLVPRADGEVILGATQEETGAETSLTAGGVYRILRDAHEIVPGVSEMEIAETCVGLRPGSPDNDPFMGPTDVPGLLLAVGHFRHGVLLAPATGDALAAALADGALPAEARHFAAARKSRVAL